MKKLLFLFIAFLTLSTLTYASFPVTENNIVLNNLPIEAPPPSTDWGLAAICFFVGCLGIHRFIMGDTWIGIAQLITLGGLGIWVLIDFIRILMGDLSR